MPIQSDNQSENKKTGRHRGGSPSAYLWHDRSLCSSDLPTLFISTFIIMLHNEKRTEQLSDMALEAVENVLISDELPAIRESLEDFFLEWVQCEDSREQEERIRRVFHYRVLLSLLSEVERIQAARDVA